MVLDNKIEELFSEDRINIRIKELGEIFTNLYDKTDDVVIICLLRGGFIFTSDLVRNIKRNVIIDFMSVSSYGDETISSGQLKIEKDISVDISNKHVIIVDDIIDTGLTMKEIKELLFKRNPKSIKTCCLLDKEEGRTVNMTVDYCGFKCPNKYVIGYGMDSCNSYRNLPYIGILNT